MVKIIDGVFHICACLFLLNCTLFFTDSECLSISRTGTDVPWHAVIKNKRNNKIQCYGTIISPQLILTTEFCVCRRHNKENVVCDDNPDNYGVYVSDVPQTDKLFRIKEFRYFNRTNSYVDGNRYHEIIIIILKDKIMFNSDVSPACVQWTNPEKINFRNGTAMAVTLNNSTEKISDVWNLHPYNFTLLSHDACKEKWAYPYFVYAWASMMYERGQKNDTFLRRENLLCLVLERGYSKGSLLGSGVMFESNNCHFIRGIAGAQLELKYILSDESEQQRFKIFINSLDDNSYANLSQNLSQTIINGSITALYPDEIAYYNRNFAGILKTHLIEKEEWSEDHENMAGVTDISGYVDWIKKVRDEVDLMNQVDITPIIPGLNSPIMDLMSYLLDKFF